MKHACRNMQPFFYLYVFAGSHVVQSKRAMDGGRERTADTHRPGMEINGATATEVQRCRLEQCNNKEQQQKQTTAEIKTRRKTEAQRSSLSRGVEDVIAGTAHSPIFDPFHV